MSSPGDPKTDGVLTECLVLVSDTSTEAERLIASLRVRGFKVRDVPLMLLPGRVEAQRPRLVICDAHAAGVAQSLTRMRQGAWGSTVELLLLGIEPKLNDLLVASVPDIKERTFSRPIDVYSVLQRVEEILGNASLSSRPGSRSMAALPRVGVPSLTAAGRAPTPPLRRGRSSIPGPPSPLAAMAAAARGEVQESQQKGHSIAPPSETSTPDSALQVVPVARMSHELEQLLGEADRRLAAGPMSVQPLSLPSSRLTPEQELDAILPPDVLVALDEPVDLDEEDETSHPAARQRDRSSLAPRARTASTNEQLVPSLEDLDDGAHGVGTVPPDDNTPVGRVAGRGRTGTSGWTSETTGAPAQGSSPTPTPAPASVKTHHTHHTQANSAPYLSVGDPIEPAPNRQVLPLAAQASDRKRRVELDSVAPGTNPEVESGPSKQPARVDAMIDREMSATVPPRPFRNEAPSLGQPWEALDEPAWSFKGGQGTIDAQPPPTMTNRGEALPPSTSPPANARGRAATNVGTSRADPFGGIATGGPSPASESQVDPAPREDRLNVEVPPALGRGDVIRALSRCVRSRYSGALALEDEAGIRRVVMREGDFVMVASGIDGESLVAFLIQRGDLVAEAARLARKLPQFGRHAGAALIAHGYLRQDELWSVLRAHAEWLLGRALGMSQGSASLESELPARLAAEPAVFGGATGAEILIEVVRRVVPPEIAIEALGGPRVRIGRGSMARLLSECALSTVEAQLVERAAGLTLDELLIAAKNADFAAAVYAMVELSVLSTLAPAQEPSQREPKPALRDGLDDAAVRGRVAIRRGLVDDGDYFALLGIPRDATGYEVRHAYLELRREFEPSRLLTASTANLREDVELVLDVLDEAYEVLRDAARRERYRRALEAAPAPGE